jgi:hypothetical protein
MSSLTRDEPFVRSSIIIVLLVFLLCWVRSFIGSDVVMFLLFWGPALVYLLFFQPVHIAARVLLLLGLILEGPEDRPGNGYWEPPFASANTVFYQGLNKWLSIPGASFALFTVLWALLLVRAIRVNRSRTARPSPESRSAIKIYLVGVALAIAWGMLHGGQIQPMFWQLIYPINTALAVLAITWAARGKQDMKAYGAIIVVVAITKAAIVFWVYEVVCRPLNIRPFYATTHSDSVNFAGAFAVLLNRAFEERSKAALRSLAILTPLIVIGVYMNNRRMAFVSMAASVVVAVLLMKPGKAKKRIAVIAMVLAPVVGGYVAVGRNSDSPFFALAKAIGTVTSSSDSSSETRDIENYNLYVTLKQAIPAGTGFGNMYVEAVAAEDISGGHALYRYIPHNSVLWLVSVGGILVFHLIWLPNAMLAYLGYRVHRNARAASERVAGLTCLSALFIFMFQAWGDMGINGYTPGLIFAGAYALAARLDGEQSGITKTLGKARQA